MGAQPGECTRALPPTSLRSATSLSEGGLALRWISILSQFSSRHNMCAPAHKPAHKARATCRAQGAHTHQDDHTAPDRPREEAGGVTNRITCPVAGERGSGAATQRYSISGPGRLLVLFAETKRTSPYTACVLNVYPMGLPAPSPTGKTKKPAEHLGGFFHCGGIADAPLLPAARPGELCSTAYRATAFSSGISRKITQPGCHRLHQKPRSK